jgi:hypothetical protein
MSMKFINDEFVPGMKCDCVRSVPKFLKRNLRSVFAKWLELEILKNFIPKS